jgi:hypothetical protein
MPFHDYIIFGGNGRPYLSLPQYTMMLCARQCFHVSVSTSCFHGIFMTKKKYRQFVEALVQDGGSL